MLRRTSTPGTGVPEGGVSHRLALTLAAAATLVVAVVAAWSTPGAAQEGVTLSLGAVGTADFYMVDVFIGEEFFAPELPWTTTVPAGATVSITVVEVGEISCAGDNGALVVTQGPQWTGADGVLPLDAAAVDCIFTEQPGLNDVPFTFTNAAMHVDSVVVDLFIGPGALQREVVEAGGVWATAVRAGVEVELFVELPGQLSCTGDGGSLIQRMDSERASFSGTLGDEVTSVDCTFVGGQPLPTPTPIPVPTATPVAGEPTATPMPPTPTPTPMPFPVDISAAGVYPTATCLGGNGRLDINVVNPGADATYRLEVGGLTPREHEVGARDWWRTPITGRPDGSIDARLWRDGALIFDELLTVACDVEPSVSGVEAQHMVACRGLGFVVWQFANPTDASRSYVIDFDGVPDRSTTAPAHGAAVRGVSGRPNGDYGYQVVADGMVIDQGIATVAC